MCQRGTEDAVLDTDDEYEYDCHGSGAFVGPSKVLPVTQGKDEEDSASSQV